MGLAILSARIFTGDARNPWAEALHVDAGRIVAVGSNQDVEKTCNGRLTQKLELPGRLVTPGLVDAHCHFISLGMALQMVDLRGLPSIAACRAVIRSAAAELPPGTWVIGRGWHHHYWEEKREPNRADLDDITPQHPAMMIRQCGHTVWVNSAALEKAHISRESPDPPGGRIERNSDGTPNGLVREARDLIENHIPPPGPEDRKRAARLAQQEALRAGLTCVHTCEGLPQWDALAAMDRERQLTLRVHHLLPPEDLEEALVRRVNTQQQSDRLWLGPVKIFADGTLGSGTALLHAPYSDDPSEIGLPFLEPAVLRQKVELAYENGFDVAIHAIGDRAVTNALVCITEARERFAGPRRDRIEHVQLFRPEDLALFRSLGVVASVQPAFVPTDRPLAEKRWGLSRCRYAYAWKTLLEAGIPLQFGSDAPVEPIRPLWGLRAAVTRQDVRGDPPEGWFPGQRLTLQESLRGFTQVAAWTSHRENQLGSLTPGRWADLTIFNRDLSSVPPDQWAAVEVEMTVVGGEIVYTNDAIP